MAKPGKRTVGPEEASWGSLGPLFELDKVLGSRSEEKPITPVGVTEKLEIIDGSDERETPFSDLGYMNNRSSRR